MGAMMQGGKGRRGGIVAINITPMVDVMLVLLVIMMVSAKYIVSRSLKVELPRTATSDENVSSTLAVTITEDGTYHLNKQAVADDAALSARFKAARAAGTDVNLIISADDQSRHGRVVRVIDLAKQQDITKFAINVQRE